MLISHCLQLTLVLFGEFLDFREEFPLFWVLFFELLEPLDEQLSLAVLVLQFLVESLELLFLELELALPERLFFFLVGLELVALNFQVAAVVPQGLQLTVFLADHLLELGLGFDDFLLQDSFLRVKFRLQFFTLFLRLVQFISLDTQLLLQLDYFLAQNLLLVSHY